MKRSILHVVIGLIVCLGISNIHAQTTEQETLLFSQSQQLSPELKRVRTLIRGNVLDLAQSILETTAPAVLPTEQWLQWERQLWALYRTRQEWSRLLTRVSQIPPAFPASVKREAQLQAVRAYISLQQGVLARQLLRQHLLSNELAETEKRKLRQDLIESYLADGMLNEAIIAMEKFQNDYRSKDESWLLVSAQVYMRLELYDDAINLLAPLNSMKARLLRSYARLRNGSITSEQAFAKLDALMLDLESGDSDGSVEKYEILSVKIYAKQLISDLSVVNDIEIYLSEIHSGRKLHDRSIPSYSVETLHEEYQKNTLTAANLAGLLIGDTDRLFDFAVQLSPDKLITKKSIYGYLLKNTTNLNFNLQLNTFYVSTLIQTDSTAVIPVLYGEEKSFSRLRIGGDVGLALSNRAIETGDIELAAFINNSLTESPQGMGPFDWLLHVSRISIIAGDYETGNTSLNQLLGIYPEMTPEKIDQVLQPIFDLQTVNQHQYALALLLKLEPAITTAKHEREISYWIAESYQANRQFIRAADYYLHSALLKDNGLDQWGESARFHAAECLQSANLYSDASSIFKGLYDRSQDEGRRSQFQQRIQELRLLESSLKDSDS